MCDLVRAAGLCVGCDSGVCIDGCENRPRALEDAGMFLHANDGLNQRVKVGQHMEATQTP